MNYIIYVNRRPMLGGFNSVEPKHPALIPFFMFVIKSYENFTFLCFDKLPIDRSYS